ncbi:MAG: metallophosphoesterase [Deltaproteobacteria bacterium]|nr:metallophosphoesterase [Deltaproteobacteria bacterium]
MSKNGKIISGLTRREFAVASSGAVVFAACTNSTGTSDNNSVNNLNDASNDADVDDVTDITDVDSDVSDDDSISPPPQRPVTTATETVRGVLQETLQFEDLRPSFGLTKKGPGEPHQDRDDFNAVSASNGVLGTASSLLYFAQLTDIHITDEESPARSIHSPLAQGSAWRPQEPWSTHILAAAVETINSFTEVRPHDFVLFSGDMTDNHLGIEVSWFLDCLEGNLLDPDTGTDDNPMEDPGPDPHDPYQPTGFLPEVRWYAALGNHDLLVLGNFDTLDFSIADPTGDSATLFLSDAVIPTCFDEPVCPDISGSDVYCYSETPARCYIPNTDDYYDSRDTAADSRRAYASRNDFMSMIMASTKNGPSGHGFNQMNIDNGTSYWVDENPVPGIPVALVTLDSSSEGGITSSAAGYMSDTQINWLQSVLDNLVSQNKLIVVMSHHCSRDITNNGNTLVTMLNNCPNVVLHITGHHHTHQVIPHPPENSDMPWMGYYEVQTCGLLDWPQQMRFWELVDLGDGTGMMYSTIVDINMPPESTVEAGRFYALLDLQEGRTEDGEGPGTEMDRNVAIRVAWPPDMVDVLSSLPVRDVETYHFSDSLKNS